MGGIFIDPWLLDAAAGTIESAAGDFGSEFTSLQGTVGADNPWGGDEAGTIFGGLYAEVLGHALETLGSHQQQLLEASAKTKSWVKVMEATEDANTGLLTGTGN